MPTDLARRHSLIRPLPYAGTILLAALLAAGFFALGGHERLPAGETPLLSGRGVAAPSFGVCARPPHINCVMDGDTFYLEGESIRIADIDAPETHPARCTYEKELGERATHRLRTLLNARPFEIRPYERDRDMYGRKLRVIARDGQSIGGILVSEGLARPWGGKREPWCG